LEEFKETAAVEREEGEEEEIPEPVKLKETKKSKKKKKKKKKGAKYVVGEIIEVRDLSGGFAGQWRKAEIMSLTEPLQCQVIGFSGTYTYDEYRKLVEKEVEKVAKDEIEVDDDTRVVENRIEPLTQALTSEQKENWTRKRSRPKKRKKKESPGTDQKPRPHPTALEETTTLPEPKRSANVRIISNASVDMAWQDPRMEYLNILRENAPPSPPATHRLPPPIRPRAPPPSDRPASGYGFLGASPLSSDASSENDMKLGDLVVTNTSRSPERQYHYPYEDQIDDYPDRGQTFASCAENDPSFNGFHQNDFHPKQRSFSPDRQRLPDAFQDGLAHHERNYESQRKHEPNRQNDYVPREYVRYPSPPRDFLYESPPRRQHWREGSVSPEPYYSPRSRGGHILQETRSRGRSRGRGKLRSRGRGRLKRDISPNRRSISPVHVARGSGNSRGARTRGRGSRRRGR